MFNGCLCIWPSLVSKLCNHLRTYEEVLALWGITLIRVLGDVAMLIFKYPFRTIKNFLHCTFVHAVMYFIVNSASKLLDIYFVQLSPISNYTTKRYLHLGR